MSKSRRSSRNKHLSFIRILSDKNLDLFLSGHDRWLGGRGMGAGLMDGAPKDARIASAGTVARIELIDSISFISSSI
jgi:hypothetical protein